MNAWWKIGIVLGYTLLITGATWRVAAWKYAAADQKRTIAEQAETIAAGNGVIAAERAANKTTNEVSNEYQNRVSVIDDQYRAALTGMHTGTEDSAGGGMPAVPPAQPGYHAPACADRLSRRNQEAVIALMRQADLQTARLVACQAWIARHSGH